MPPKRPASTTRISVAAHRDGKTTRRSDDVATEEPMEIRVVAWEGGKQRSHSVAVTMRTPGSDFELAAGFLFSEGVVAEKDAIESISYCLNVNAGTGGPFGGSRSVVTALGSGRDGARPSTKQEQLYNIVNVFLKRGVAFDPQRFTRHVFTSSSCGVCGKATLEQIRAVLPNPIKSAPKLSDDFFLGLPETLRQQQAIFERTGGLHAAALFDANGKLLLSREDVGRHNAMDKLVGALLLKNQIPASDKIVLVSGRASFELVQKALMAGIPVLAAVGAPSSLAVDLAKEFGMTLVGFLREGRFNVYTGA
jgi:FdhD protein